MAQECGCIRKYGFDLDLGFRDCKTLLLSDVTTWVGGGPPDYIEVDIALPYRDATVKVRIPTGGTVALTSVDLLGSEAPQCLPDGIFCISVSACGVKHQINRAFLCSIQCQVDTIRAAGNRTEDFVDTARFQEMIEGITINAQQGKADKAGRLIQLLKQQLERFNCACGCSSGML